MSRAAVVFAMAALAAPALAQGVDPNRMQPCPYAIADLRSALGGEWRAGKPSEQPSAQGRMLGCSYLAVSSGQTLLVSQTWIPKKILAETNESIDRYASGRFVPVRGDADRARWLVDPQAPQSMTLVYLRGNVRTETRLLGASGTEQAIQARLLKLRRVP